MGELRALQDAAGWEVAGHAWTLAAHNAGYNTLTAAQVAAELRLLKAWLVSNGFTGDSFAYPGGHFDATTDGVPVDRLAGQYFASGRSIIGGLAEAWAPPMPMRTKAITGISSAAGGVPVGTLTAAGGVIQRCAQQGAWLQLCLHQVVASGVTSPTQILTSDLAALLASIAGYGMTVLPASAVTRDAALPPASVDIATPGAGLAVAEGSNCKQGLLTCNGTTAVTVANTAVTANSRIFLSIQTPGGTPGSPFVSARTPGTSFAVKSTGASDTSTVAFLITEPG